MANQYKEMTIQSFVAEITKLRPGDSIDFALNALDDPKDADDLENWLYCECIAGKYDDVYILIDYIGSYHKPYIIGMYEAKQFPITFGDDFTQYLKSFGLKSKFSPIYMELHGAVCYAP